MRSRAAGATAIAAALLLVALSGCAPSSSAPTSPSTTPPSTAPVPDAFAAASAAATDGSIAVAVTQGRSDYAGRVFALTVTNTAAADVTVRSFVLSSPSFAADVVWEGESTVPPGSARALRVPVPAFACPVDARSLSVDLTVERNGESTAVTLAPTDPLVVIERLSSEACLAEDTDDVVTIGLSDDLPIAGSGATAVARLSLTLTPSGDPATGPVRIVGVDATTLLSPADGASRWSLDETVTGDDDPQTLVLEASPARCDAHALAEDKVGTVLRVRVALSDGREGLVSVPASAALKAALYAFVSTTCA